MPPSANLFNMGYSHCLKNMEMEKPTLSEYHFSEFTTQKIFEDILTSLMRAS